MSRTMIIGYGNPLRGDDAVGYHAARMLSDVVSQKEIVIRTCHQLTPELAPEISTFEKVIFIDASVGENAGTLKVSQLNHSDISERTISHHFDPESVLTCSHILYGRVPEAYLVTITANSFGYLEDLSAPVKLRLPELTQAVLRIIGQEART
jgi:hydrogenase maturation protease